MISLNPTKILEQYFDIRPLGVSICNGITPPPEAFDALLLHLAGDMDCLRWQTAATCNLYERYHRKQAHLMAASRFDCSPDTIAHWCYIERKVPYNARVGGLSIWFHKLVATVPDSALQREYLEECKKHGWSESAFEQWLKDKKGLNLPEHHYQSDRQFEQDKKFYNMVDELAQLRHDKAELEARLNPEISQDSESFDLPPDSVPEVDNLARPIIGWLESVGYSALIIRRNGRIVIKP